MRKATTSRLAVLQRPILVAGIFVVGGATAFLSASTGEPNQAQTTGAITDCRHEGKMICTYQFVANDKQYTGTFFWSDLKPLPSDLIIYYDKKTPSRNSTLSFRDQKANSLGGVFVAGMLLIGMIATLALLRPIASRPKEPRPLT